MSPSVLMLCPSRSRPGHVERLRDAWAATTKPDEADLLVAVDEDDPLLPIYQSAGPVKVIPPMGWLGPILNQLAAEYAPQYDVIGFLGDDHRPRTPGWASTLAGALADQPGVAYGNDLNQGPAAATAVLISSQLLRTLGYMVPGRVRHLCMDLFWIILGQETFLAYYPGIILEHLHPTLGKVPWDAGYAARNSPAQFAWDWQAYDEFLREQWPADLARLQAALVTA